MCNNLEQVCKDRNCYKISRLRVLGSSMEIGLCWYRKGTNNKWTYDLMDPLMVDLETKTALASI